jgi:hypothetical protein
LQCLIHAWWKTKEAPNEIGTLVMNFEQVKDMILIANPRVFGLLLF